MRLIDVYNEGVDRNLIRGSYEDWRSEVVMRINKLFKVGLDLTDNEIEYYFREELYENLVTRNCLRVL
jgi:hypothetical protein